MEEFFDVITIKNFQAHKETTLELSEGLNVITGDTDSGKSSILRACRWLSEGRPTGDSIKNWNSPDEKTEVVLCTKDNKRIGKIRKDKTVYSFGRKVYEATKTEVPQEIRDFLNLSDINIQTQHQRYFLLDDSPGEVARKLNELVGLDIITTIYKRINHKIASVEEEIRRDTDEMKRIQTELDELLYIEKFDASLKKLESLIEKKTVIEKKHGLVCSAIQNFNEIESEIEKLTPVLKIKEKVESLYDSILEHSRLVEKTTKVEDLIRRVAQYEAKIKEIQVQFIDQEDSVNQMLEDIKRYNVLNQEYMETEELLRRMGDVDNCIAEQEAVLRKKESEYKTFVKEYKVCPLCKSPLPKEVPL
mgnify:CR=1 FL=1